MPLRLCVTYLPVAMPPKKLCASAPLRYYLPVTMPLRLCVTYLPVAMPPKKALRLCASALLSPRNNASASLRYSPLVRTFELRTAGRKPSAHTKASSQTVSIAGERKGRSPNEWQTVAAVPTKTATTSGGRW